MTSLDGEIVQAFIDPDAWVGVASDGESLFWGAIGGVRRGIVGAGPADYTTVIPMEYAAAVVTVGDYVVGFDVEVDPQLTVAAEKDGSNPVTLAAGSYWTYLDADAEAVYVRTNEPFSLEDPRDIQVVRFVPPDPTPQVVLTTPLWAEFDVHNGWLYAYSLVDGLIRIPVAQGS